MNSEKISRRLYNILVFLSGIVLSTFTLALLAVMVLLCRKLIMWKIVLGIILSIPIAVIVLIYFLVLYVLLFEDVDGKDTFHPFHYWLGCTCRICGQTRDEYHFWNGCKCLQCAKVRDEEHLWKACICKRCGTIRNEGHVFKGCKCINCYTTRDEGHDWNRCTCIKCYKTRHVYENCICKFCGIDDHEWKRVKPEELKTEAFKDFKYFNEYDVYRCSKCLQIKEESDDEQFIDEYLFDDE